MLDSYVVIGGIWEEEVREGIFEGGNDSAV
jgi:hypothetical protein